MAKRANPGELKTPVLFMRVERESDGEGFAPETFKNVFGEDFSEDVKVMCKWVNTHGTEVFVAMQLKLRDPVTITTRYSPWLDDVSLILFRDGDDEPYEIISVDNVEQRNEWLEIKAQRRVSARLAK